MIIAFDEKYKRFSPGNVLDESMMRYVFENYRSADGSHLDITFGPGMERFKLHWSRGYVHPARSYRIVTSGRAWAKTRLKQTIAQVLTPDRRRAHRQNPTRWGLPGLVTDELSRVAPAFA
jgi:hypothetical protein